MESILFNSKYTRYGIFDKRKFNKAFTAKSSDTSVSAKSVLGNFAKYTKGLFPIGFGTSLLTEEGKAVAFVVDIDAKTPEQASNAVGLLAKVEKALTGLPYKVLYNGVANSVGCHVWLTFNEPKEVSTLAKFVETETYPKVGEYFVRWPGLYKDGVSYSVTREGVTLNCLPAVEEFFLSCETTESYDSIVARLATELTLVGTPAPVVEKDLSWTEVAPKTKRETEVEASIARLRKIVESNDLAGKWKNSDKGVARFVLEKCLFSEEHSDPSADGKGDASLYVSSQGKLCYQCFHTSCQAKKWNDAKALLKPEKARKANVSAKKVDSIKATCPVDISGCFNDEGNLIPMLFIDKIIEAHATKGTPLAYREDSKTLYEWSPDENKWVVIEPETMNMKILDYMIPDKDLCARVVTPYIRTILRKELRSVVQQRQQGCIKWNNVGSFCVPFLNGIYNVRTGKFLEKTAKELYCTKCVPHAYQPEFLNKFAGSHVEAVLKDYQLDNETLNSLQEFFGYAFLPNKNAQKALWLYGEGNRGKSLVLTLLAHAVGACNTSISDYVTLVGKHTSYQYVDKFVHKVDEVGQSELWSVEGIKNMITSSQVAVEAKYQHRCESFSHCKYIFSANTLPISRDKTDGWLRRFLIIPFYTPLNKCDKNIEERLFDFEDSLPILVAWAMEGAKRLVANEMEITISDASSGASKKLMSLNDAMADFISEEDYVITKKDEDRLPFEEVYASYYSWATNLGLEKRMDKRAFAIAFDLKSCHKIRVRKGNTREFLLTGIKKRE